MLLALVLIPLGLWAYRAIGRRRRSVLARRGGPGLADGVTRRPRRPRAAWIPAGLVVVGLGVLVVALARPQGVVDLPREEGTVILAFDVSGSMAADDLKPTRMEAAKAAASDFVERQPSSVVIGRRRVQRRRALRPGADERPGHGPRRDRPAHARPGGRRWPTAILPPSTRSPWPRTRRPPTTTATARPRRSPTDTPAPVPAGTHGSAVIVLLTRRREQREPRPAGRRPDGGRPGRPDRHGRHRQRRPAPTLDLNGFKVHTQLDEALLQQIAQMTGGTYYHADRRPGPPRDLRRPRPAPHRSSPRRSS